MGKYKTGIGKLLSAMKKNIREVNDQEVCRRLEILMHSEKEDMNINLVKRLLESPPYDVDPRDVPEPFSQYVKHYYYMIRREERIKLKEGELPESSKTKKNKPTSKKKALSSKIGKTSPEKSLKKSDKSKKLTNQKKKTDGGLDKP